VDVQIFPLMYEAVRGALAADDAAETPARLLAEVQSLNTRANVNLAVGSAISLIGLAILTWFVWITSNELSSHLAPSDVGIRFVVRLTLAAFIQIFAYFFLRLYRHNLFETKYFQNEATNAEFRLISLMAATIHSDQKLLERVCLELVKTERNFILKKGETTVANQRELIEKDYDALISKTIETVAARYQQTPHETHDEPPRDCRRPFCLSHAATAASVIMA
jgi:hypothetical protein